MPNTIEKMIELAEVIDSYFGCDAAYFDVDKFTLAKRIMEAGWTKQEWISVKDRLPDTKCLAVSMLTGPAYEEMLVGYVAEASNWDTGYECESDGEILPNVTHWMPLPQPPKGE
jgi:hypothetical protein